MLENKDFFTRYYKSEGTCHPVFAYRALSHALEAYMEELDPVDKMKFQAELHPFIKEALAIANEEEKNIQNEQGLILIESDRLYTINSTLQKKPEPDKKSEKSREEQISVQVPKVEISDIGVSNWPEEEITPEETIPFGLFSQAEEEFGFDASSSLEETAMPVFPIEEEEPNQGEMMESMAHAIKASSERMFENITGAAVQHAESDSQVQNAESQKQGGADASSLTLDIDDLAASFMTGKMKP